MPNIYNRLGVEREKIIKIEFFFYLVLNIRNLFIVQSLHIFSFEVTWGKIMRVGETEKLFS